MLLSRQFAVDQPLAQAWQHLARAERWPTWAKHIRRVELQPPGEVGPDTTGRLTLSNGVPSTLTMVEFNLHRHWKWVGRFLWLKVYFDHRFEELNPTRTRLTWIVEAAGLGVSVFRRFLAKFYGPNLDRAIPLLVEEMKARRES
jgi:Polyketide cyclase / dehydrase and lipid transport